ncbi:MGH1-like glycoside hydrolase domain-containing protein [Hymenobacter terrenus]|uniref:MGH1-like glycoside hydrolase domain-containing protein n=1 Tax=Hymenobacter terrenus TaxID=1629124 RepID=UPI000695B092|nr:hypothetical protein [Hymenobacter terrenus]
MIKEIFGLSLLAGLLVTGETVTAQSRFDAVNLQKLDRTHNVTAPAWGPYSKQYAGISHVADAQKGMRFDFSVMPGHFERRVLVPNVLYESGYYPWQASADLNYFSFREELEWKDQVFTDVAFAPFDAHARVVQIKLINRTANMQNLVVHLVQSLHYPDVNPLRAVLPGQAVWKSAYDYIQLTFAKPRPQDNLTADALRKGQARGNDFVGGNGLGQGFGKDIGDQTTYSFTVPNPIQDACLLLRYRAPKGTTNTLATEGICTKPISVAGTGQMEVARVPLGQVAAGPQRLRLRALGNGALELDGFTVVANYQVDSVAFITDFHPIPKIVNDEQAQTVVLKYPDVAQHYGVAWQHKLSMLRQFHNDELDVDLPLTVNRHISREFFGNSRGHYTDILLRAVPLQANQTKTLYAVVCEGTPAEIAQSMARFRQEQDYSRYFTPYETQLQAMRVNPAGEKYRFGNQMIRTNTLQNIVYPVYAAGEYIKHFTPGRLWNSLYTWDSGFIGLGMTEIDTVKAAEILNAYTTDATDPNAFVHHGSLVPTQFYVFQELWQRTRSRQLLTYFYPRLRKYYLFYTGQAGSSTTRMAKSGLLRPWDYFYNSGGWDDYPPQRFVHSQKGYTDHVAPVVSTAQAIRIAKIMRQTAAQLGNRADVRRYDQDIATFTQALQRYSWDPASGYFGYVLHAPDGTPSGILRTDKGVNFNMGVDGISPLMAGICTPAQQQQLLSHLFSEKALWTPVGATAVDQSAPYYDAEGYWNGAVWFPHQWFFWKALLDLGEGDRAAQIALTALNAWEKEAELTYNSPEHFSVETGRGTGWQQFSGLSTPILSWFGAYFRPGTLTTGFDTWVQASTFSVDNTQLDATLTLSAPGTTPTVLVCLKAGPTYRATVNGRSVPCTQAVSGALQLVIPATASRQAKLKIVASK